MLHVYIEFALMLHTYTEMPASVAQSDVRQTGDQVVAPISAVSGNILSWRLTMKYFLRSFTPFC